ncbi:zymogen granule membrane protein 16-like isoform X2 [Xyrauchen texanus]|uniref:zymogen granule membrane protein 16-like isoform X1 n=1 Tax=Xyrauchen texanus TaxID=154827 RepID=UPI0022429642|nr:zymogen granule membrane protein 16-like isoform X1 [Xyrauchen texanus]XP_052003287.1 zymogen granule membrane protein 16-like isoform X2 [Xyrauchen texanus]
MENKGETVKQDKVIRYTVGDGSGNEYSTAHVGRITGIRVWEYSSTYIRGIQLRYDRDWTEVIGVNYGTLMEMTLLDNESIIQVSGKYDNGYIYEFMFVTNHGRSFKVGQPSGTSFNFYPTHDGSELRFLSGRQNGNGITSIGAHWAVNPTSVTNVMALGSASPALP